MHRITLHCIFLNLTRFSHAVCHKTKNAGSRPPSWESLKWKMMPDNVRPTTLFFYQWVQFTAPLHPHLFISYNRKPHCGLTIPIIIQITETKEAKRSNEEWIFSHLKVWKDKTTSMLKSKGNTGHDWPLLTTHIIQQMLQDIELMIQWGLKSLFLEIITFHSVFLK